MIPRRIWGVETEYGITCASLDGDVPPMDADEAARHMFRPVVASGRSTNVFMANGGRLYLDVGSHPEYATAECDTLPDLLAQDRAGAEMLAELAATASAEFETQGIRGRLHLFRNNVDSAGNSFGCHENYLVRRRPDFPAMVASLIPYFVSRQIVAGAGFLSGGALAFSQRATQTWDATSSATTRSRPIVNTRDEPHADVDLYRRMHVIVGDSNMAEGSTLVKVAATNLVLAAVESGERFSLELSDPMRAIREFSTDLTGTVTAELTDGRRMTAAAIQRYYFDAVAELADEPWHESAVDLWRRGIEAVETGRHELVETELDWAIKQKLVTGYAARPGANSAGLKRLVLAYHDTTDNLRAKMEQGGLMRRFTTPEAVRNAAANPPATTRAALRGAFVAAAQEHRRDHAVDWMHLKLADPSQRAVVLSDPFATSNEAAEKLIAAARA
ncbi:proteasome accessory factor A [Ruaniaceae bacterium KH17]|nr:proteasome accessory factor A [Ruaniaceae bacterium KH17]